MSGDAKGRRDNRAVWKLRGQEWKQESRLAIRIGETVPAVRVATLDHEWDGATARQVSASGFPGALYPRQVHPEPVLAIGPCLFETEATLAQDALDHRHRVFVAVFGMDALAESKGDVHIDHRHEGFPDTSPFANIACSTRQRGGRHRG